MNVTNEQAGIKKKINLSDFLTCPDTPKRSRVHRNYKRKFYPVFTAGERLEEIYRIIQQRKEKAEMRAEKKAESEKLKEVAREMLAEKKAEREKLKAATREMMKEKAEKQAAKKIEAEKLKEAMREQGERKRQEAEIRKQEREHLRKQK